MTPLMVAERIRSLRHLLGISQDQLSDAVGVSQALISQIESGGKEASGELLAAIAKATSTPDSFFHVRPVDIPLGTLRFRKYASARRTDTKRVKALFDEAFRVTTDLLEEAEYPPPNLPVAAADPTDDELERLAGKVREALHLENDGPIKHLTRAVERAGLAVAPLTLPGEHDAEEEPIGHFGVSHWWGAHDIGLIGYFTGPGDRQRFTIAHEIAHLVLHSRRGSALNPEDEANRLAGAILLPRVRAEQILGGPVNLRDLAVVKAAWGISIQALIMRGNHIGLIDEQRKVSLFKQLSARGWRKEEPVPVHAEEPRLLWRLLASRFGDPVPYQQAGHDLGLSPVILKSLAPPPSIRTNGKAVPTKGAVLPLRPKV